MGHSVRDYLERLSTEQLKQMLRSHCDGRFEITVETVLLVCEILSKREPGKYDPHEAYKRFCEYYLDKK